MWSRITPASILHGSKLFRAIQKMRSTIFMSKNGTRYSNNGFVRWHYMKTDSIKTGKERLTCYVHCGMMLSCFQKYLITRLTCLDRRCVSILMDSCTIFLFRNSFLFSLLLLTRQILLCNSISNTCYIFPLTMNSDFTCNLLLPHFSKFILFQTTKSWCNSLMTTTF